MISRTATHRIGEKPLSAFPRSPEKGVPLKDRTPQRPTTYPAGYFAALVIRHNWPPMFTPRIRVRHD